MPIHIYDEGGIVYTYGPSANMVYLFSYIYILGTLTIDFALYKRLIENALEQDRVEVFLQPIFSNHKKHFTSAEALVRIRKETGDFLSPAKFISIAEESGQIIKLGERVFGKGESNLMYVVEMPVAIIKFDYDMTKAFFQSQKAQHVIRSVVKMAHDMDKALEFFESSMLDFNRGDGI